MLLTTVGRKSGRKWTVPALDLRDGERVLCVASKGAWITTLSGTTIWSPTPEVEVQIGSDVKPMRAHTATEAERTGPLAAPGRDVSRLRRLPGPHRAHHSRHRSDAALRRDSAAPVPAEPPERPEWHARERRRVAFLGEARQSSGWRNDCALVRVRLSALRASVRGAGVRWSGSAGVRNARLRSRTRHVGGVDRPVQYEPGSSVASPCGSCGDPRGPGACAMR